MVMEDASQRVAAVVGAVGEEAQVGFHGHENLSLSLANTILAVRAGAVQVDGSTRRFGAGAGNTSVEAMAAVFERLGIRTGIDVLQIIDAAQDVVRPVMDEECILDRMSLIMGYAGVYSSFLKQAYRSAERYGVSGADILLECGRQHLVGGQEDQIIQIAAELARNGARPAAAVG
jgi:4-hydroxy 2-oxovalerate aldolase